MFLPLDDLADWLVDRTLGRWSDDRSAIRRARRELRGPAPVVACALRVPDGSDARVAGFGAGWSRGAALLLPGALAFTALGARDVTARLVIEDVVTGTRLGRSTPVEARLYTPDGPLEWAVRPELLDAAVAAVRPRSA